MIRNEKYCKRLAEKIEICNQKIENGEDENLWGDKLCYYCNRLTSIKLIEEKVESWEKENHMQFNGTVNDVYHYGDLISECNESQFGEKPSDLIADGIYTPIPMYTAQWELKPNEYWYLPSSLIKRTIK